MTFEEIKKDPAIRVYIAQADAALDALGYTEHSFAHVTQVAERAGYILQTLQYSAREIELAKIAGYLHDIGNMVNRTRHCQSGAVLAFGLLEKHGFSPDEIATVVCAIGNHDESAGTPVNPVAAALILADKSDVRRTRVRAGATPFLDIHDRVNYSVISSELKVNEERTVITLILKLDTAISSVMDYFEIFLERMMLCRKAAERLGLHFQFIVNDQQMI